jgi:hypothetical protein
VEALTHCSALGTPYRSALPAGRDEVEAFAGGPVSMAQLIDTSLQLCKIIGMQQNELSL